MVMKMQSILIHSQLLKKLLAECERNIEMINYMNDLIDQVGLDYIQSIIDKNDAILC